MVIRKRGIFFTLDAILAASIIIVAIILASQYYVRETKTETMDYLAHDLVRVFTNMKVSEIDNEYVATLISNGSITRLNNTILEQIGEFWSENDIGTASTFAENVTEKLIPQRFGVGIWVNGELIYKKSKPVTKTLVSSRKLISGIAKEKPIEGYTARAVLTGINSKITSAYVYFGGYEGDGNLTKKLILPSNLIAVKNASLELDVGNDFDLYINGIASGSYIKGSAGGYMVADKWNISSAYLNNFRAGENLIKIAFSDTENNYVAGGHLKVVYATSDVNDTLTLGSERFYLPGIEGFINLYSAIYVPGNLTTMEIYLDFTSNFTTYLKIGNTTLYKNNPEGRETITLSNATLSAIFSSNNLSYDNLSLKTLPLRMGSLNATSMQGNADAVLVTDVSGSMEFCSNATGWSSSGWLASNSKGCLYWSGWWLWQYLNSVSDDGYVEFNRTMWAGENSNLCGCRWHPLCGSDRTKMSIYKDAAKLFVDTLLGITGNKVGIVEYSSNWQYVYEDSCSSGSNRVTPYPDSIVRTHDLSNNRIEINNTINTTESWWGTCICCGVNNATAMLNSQSSLSRNRSMIVMSDGEANIECEEQGTGDAKQDAIEAAQSACSQGIRVYTIGFGADVDEATLQAMACGGGSYHSATNPLELENVYREIAGEISSVSYVEQIAANVTASSTLNYTSYIHVNYTPVVPIEFGKVPITTETDRFDNNITQGTLTIPQNISVIDAKVTSYSGSKWTDNLIVNGGQVYKLSDYGEDYTQLGDPYIVQIPINYLNQGPNEIVISTGISPTNSTGGSKDNRAIYTLLLNGASSFTDVLANAVGCKWFLEFEDGTSAEVGVPSGYAGTSQCYYANASYYSDDAFNVAAYGLFSNLDPDNDNKLEVSLASQNIDVDSVLVSKVPSLWGPAIVEVRVWE
jgi:hypothetical protein